MKAKYYQNWALKIATLLFCVCLWEVVARRTNHNLFPRPIEVLHALATMAKSGELWGDIVSSLRRVFAGYLLGCVAGILVGMLTGSIVPVRATLGTVLQILRPIPAIAVVPFAVLWLGLGESSKCFVIAFGVFYPVWISTHLGIRAVHLHFVWVAKSLGASRWQVFFFVLLPAAANYIIAGMRTAIAIAFICLIASEWAGASSGLGYRIETSELMFQTDRMVAALVVLGIIGALCDAGFVLALRRMLPWYEAQAQSG